MKAIEKDLIKKHSAIIQEGQVLEQREKAVTEREVVISLQEQQLKTHKYAISLLLIILKLCLVII
jgi:hypothetical protein